MRVLALTAPINFGAVRADTNVVRLAHKHAGMFALAALDAGGSRADAAAAAERAAASHVVGATAGEAAAASGLGKRLLRAVGRSPKR